MKNPETRICGDRNLGRHGQKGHEIVQAIAARELDLDAAEIERLERDYVPHAVAGPLWANTVRHLDEPASFEIMNTAFDDVSLALSSPIYADLAYDNVLGGPSRGSSDDPSDIVRRWHRYSPAMPPEAGPSAPALSALPRAGARAPGAVSEGVR